MNSTEKIAAISLARVSTREQREAGNSIPGQIDRIKRYYDLHPKLKLKKEFIYDESAHSSTTGEHFNEVLKYIKKHKGKIVLVSDKVDRLIRNFVTSIHKINPYIESGKLELHFVSDNLIFHKESSSSERFYFNIAISLAQYYSDAIGDNVRRGYERILRDGRWFGKAPVGYKSVYDHEHRRVDIVPDPNSEHIVRQAFESYASGDYSVLSIFNSTPINELKDSFGNHISYNRLNALLKNPFYCGYTLSKGRKRRHQYEALIDENLFYTCQEVRERNSKNKVKYATRKFLFGSGLLTCANCGASITAEQKIKKSGKTYVYYSCTGSRGCKRDYVSERYLIQEVKQALQFMDRSDEWIADLIKTIKAVSHGRQAFDKKELRRLRSKYDQLQNRLNKLPELLLDERISIEYHDRLKAKYKSEQRNIEVSMQHLTDVDEKILDKVKVVFQITKNAGKLFDFGTPSEQRKYLDYLLQNSTLNGNTLNLQLIQPFQTIYELGKQNIMDQQAHVASFRTIYWDEVDIASYISSISK